MRKRNLAFVLAAGLCAALLGVAFATAPHACEWGLTVYSWSGVAVTVALAAIPACLLRHLPAWKLVAATLGFFALGIATLVGGVAVADMQVICRLF